MTPPFTTATDLSMRRTHDDSPMTRGEDLAQRLTHRAPPINEIALSVSTMQGGVIDPYDVRGLHESFPGLPNAERQGSVGVLELANLVGGGTNNLDFSTGPPQKWWFVSEDETRVLQAQDNLFSYNWRRARAQLGSLVDYPGFDKILEEFGERLTQLRRWHENGRKNLPIPSGCELMYDNVIPLLDGEGKKIPLSEALVEFDRADADRPSSGWNASWFETIDGLKDGDPSTLRIHLFHLGMISPETGELSPILKMTFTAGAARSSWEEVEDFFRIAHAHVQKRFLALIDRKVQATWNK